MDMGSCLGPETEKVHSRKMENLSIVSHLVNSVVLMINVQC